jgi:hypothetical protein
MKLLLFNIAAAAVITYGLAMQSNSNASSSTNSDLSLSINSVISLSVYDSASNPTTATNLSITPTPNGAQTSKLNTVVVSTNAPGYTLSLKAGDSPDVDEWAADINNETIDDLIDNDGFPTYDFPDGVVCLVLAAQEFGLTPEECIGISDTAITLCAIDSDGITCRDTDNNILCELLTTPIYAGGYSALAIDIEIYACVDDRYYFNNSADLIYQNPTDIDPKPIIPATINLISAPSSLTNNTWGFAVPKNQAAYAVNLPSTGDINSSPIGLDDEISNTNFDDIYTENSSAGKYAAPPARNKIIKQTNTTTLADATTVFYAAKVDLNTLAGDYKTTITYTATAEEIPNPPEEFKFTIDTRMTDTLFADGDTPETNPAHFAGTATSFAIPTNHSVTNSSYNWIINCGDGQPDRQVSGTPDPTINSVIICNYPVAGEYQITIKSNGTASVGWMRSFGLSAFATVDQTDKLMLKSLDTPIPKLAYNHSLFATFFGAKNTVGIPANLFSQNLSTCNFTGVFMYFATNSTTATIPAGLFSGRNSTTCKTTITEVFGVSKISFLSTFSYFAYANSASNNTPDTDINDVFTGMNFSGLDMYNSDIFIFKSTFLGMSSLVGSAQTFIDNQLGGIIPTEPAGTFFNTSVSDYSQLHTNWTTTTAP